MIEVPDLPGAGAWASPTDGSLPPLRRPRTLKRTANFLFISYFTFRQFLFFPLICRSPFGREFLAGAVAWLSQSKSASEGQKD